MNSSAAVAVRLGDEDAAVLLHPEKLRPQGFELPSNPRTHILEVFVRIVKGVRKFSKHVSPGG